MTIQDKKYNFKTKYDLSNLVIPYIEFVGSVSELAEVFEKLNRGGVKLTKYQVFAAQFSKYNLYLNNDKYNKQILTHIIERYKYLNEERSIQIEEFDEEFFYENKKINLAELCYAIGMLIIDNSEVFLFNYKNKKKSEYEDLANELGFSVMGVLTRVPNNQLSEIYKHCEKLEAEDIEEFSKKIVDIFKEINNLFKDILEIKKGKYIVDFLPSQYLSFFSTLWVIKYEKIERFKFKNRSRYSNEYNNTKNNLKYYYMIDKIKKLWGNGAVNYLNDIYINRNNIYFKPILKDDFEAVLYDWFDETLEQDSEKIIPHTKLILIYYYNTKNMDGTKFKNKMDNYDFEHIIPKEKLKKIKKLTEMKTNFPGGSIGNIGLLSTNENRGKKSDTVYFTIKDKESIGTISEVLDKLNYPTKAELDFVHSPYTEKTIKEARQLVKIRGRDIITTLVNNLYT